MKRILLPILLGIFSIQAFGQDPDLLGTWYLNYLVIDGETHEVPGNPETLEFPPHIIFEPNEIGGGMCDYMFSDIDYHPSLPEFTLVGIGSSAWGCDSTNNEDYQRLYFEFLMEQIPEPTVFQYEITNDGNEDVLITTTASSNYAVYGSLDNLSTQDNTLLNVTVFPNPTTETLYFTAGQLQVEMLSIYSITGQLVVKQTNIDNSINVASLPKGMYFLEVSAKDGKAIHKFLKE